MRCFGRDVSATSSSGIATGDDAACGGEPGDVLDLRALRCPLPALRTAARLRTLPPDACLDVLADDPLAGLDIPHLCREEGHALLAVRDCGDHARFRIRRGERSA